MKKISILGSTGSIGRQTLDIVRSNDDLEVVGLSANQNIDLLEQQVREFRPSKVCVMEEKFAIELQERLRDIQVDVLTGMEGLIDVATIDEADIIVTAIVGMIGIQPTIEAINAGKDIALANKETLVTAGHIIMPLAKEKNVSILPVDSEHSAIFQSLNGEDITKVEKIILTASGGPFRGKSIDELRNVTVKEALNHPNWAMGKKITIDSATLINKGLEVIEAKWLFNTPIDKIQVVVHPQSIIHSMVEYIDGSVIAQLGVPDMRLPIQYALFYPDRRIMHSNKLDFMKIRQLTFEEPDINTFKGLRLAYQVGNIGGSMPTVFNAANELVVDKFLNGKVRFLEVADIIEEVINNHKLIINPTVNEILETEKWTYEFIESRW